MTSVAPVIHVVDDDASFRTAVARLLRASGYQVALYESGERLLESPPDGGPGCVLLDLRMRGLSGLDLQDRLAQLGNPLPIVFLTGYGDIPASVRAIKAGAEDFLSKPVSKKPLLDAVKRALVRYEQAREQHQHLAALRALVDTLTPREQEVFALVARGKLNKQIAYELDVGETTVKAHVSEILRKLNVASRTQAVIEVQKIDFDNLVRGGGKE
jgi:FixJ family two-component response regulator